jgi:class 3 adenylate cyclase
VRRRLGNPVAVGIGYGEILDLDAMNCFGDEVNMAFKLGEDVARGLEILVTMPAWRAVQVCWPRVIDAPQGQ